MPSSVRSYHQASFKTNQYCLHLPHDDWRHNTRWPPLTFYSGFYLLPLPFIDATLLEFLNLRAKKKKYVATFVTLLWFPGTGAGTQPSSTGCRGNNSSDLHHWRDFLSSPGSVRPAANLHGASVWAWWSVQVPHHCHHWQADWGRSVLCLVSRWLLWFVNFVFHSLVS